MSDHLEERELEELCLQLVRDCRLEFPLDPWDLCLRFGVFRDRAITITSAPLGGPHSVGHLLVTPGNDRIFYDAAAAHGLQAHVICHEVIHLVRGHLADEAELTCGALVADPASTGEQQHNRVAPSRYASWQEWEAEVGATYLTGLSRRRPSPSTADILDVEVGLAAAFGLDPRPSSASSS